MQTKTALAFLLIPVRIAKMKKFLVINASDYGERKNHSPLLVEMSTHTGIISVEVSPKIKAGSTTLSKEF